MKVIALLRKNGIVFLKSSVISVIVCIVFAAGCVLAAKALSDKNAKSYTQMKIAVVNNDTSENSALAVKLLTSSVKSLNAVFSMSVMEESKAFEEIENGNISGILLIPDGAIEGYLYGNDIPITLYVSDSSPYEALILRQIGETGKKMLSSGRSGTYTVQRIMYEKGSKEKYTEISDRINMTLLSKTLGAYSDMTSWKTINISGALVPLVPHHMLCFFAFFILCSISLWGNFVLHDTVPSLLQRTICSSVSCFQIVVSKILYILIFDITATILFFITSSYVTDCSVNFKPLPIFAISMFLSSLTVLLFVLVGKNASLLISALSIIGIILGGGIIPVSLLPSFLANIGTLLPNRFIYSALSSVYTDESKVFLSVTAIVLAILMTFASSELLKIKSLYKEDEI